LKRHVDKIDHPNGLITGFPAPFWRPVTSIWGLFSVLQEDNSARVSRFSEQGQDICFADFASEKITATSRSGRLVGFVKFGRFSRQSEFPYYLLEKQREKPRPQGGPDDDDTRFYARAGCSA
jgi:hypothetical protein